VVLPGGKLVGECHKGFGQGLKPLVVGDLGLHLGRLLGGDAAGELFALEIALEDEIGAEFFAIGGAEELLAEAAAAEAVNGLHFLEDGLALLLERFELRLHGYNVYVQIH
jgi:hypothetical protein